MNKNNLPEEHRAELAEGEAVPLPPHTLGHESLPMPKINWWHDIERGTIVASVGFSLFLFGLYMYEFFHWLWRLVFFATP
jgi:hypothetical protein